MFYYFPWPTPRWTKPGTMLKQNCRVRGHIRKKVRSLVRPTPGILAFTGRPVPRGNQGQIAPRLDRVHGPPTGEHPLAQAVLKPSLAWNRTRHQFDLNR